MSDTHEYAIETQQSGWRWAWAISKRNPDGLGDPYQFRNPTHPFRQCEVAMPSGALGSRRAIGWSLTRRGALRAAERAIRSDKRLNPPIDPTTYEIEAHP